MSIEINGRNFDQGNHIVFNDKAFGICHGPEGTEVIIKYINGSDIGLYSPNREIDHWSDLDGEVANRRGWWISARSLGKCIANSNTEYTVGRSLIHRGIDLEGKPCSMLAQLDNNTIFVEFEEDVNGCSADGLGKTGHCVAVNTKNLVRKKREKHAK